jgi:hypothetical protein
VGVQKNGKNVLGVEDVAKKVYSKGNGTSSPISTWKKIEGKHTAAQDFEATNPNYGRGLPGYESNCQRCVPTYEMRRRGYDVTAKPQPENDLLQKPEYLASMFDGAEVIRYYNGSGLPEIEAAMKEWGDGARAEVVIGLKRSAHAFVAEQKNGHTFFRDPQRNLVSCHDLFAKAESEKTLLFRVDNLEVNSEIEKCCEAKK